MSLTSLRSSNVLVVSTVNVNGLRAAVRKGMLDWLDERRPDVLCLQEVRAPEGVVLEALPADVWSLVKSEPPRPGRAGVVLAARTLLLDPQATIYALPGSAGRWVEGTIELVGGDRLVVVSAYVPRGDARNDVLMAEKHAFFEGALDRLTALRQTSPLVLLAGDLNVAHREVDLDNWKAHRHTAHFRSDVREHLDRLLGELGWIDLGRQLAGEGPGPFTCWSYRGPSMFERDAGGRLDYQIATPELAALARSSAVDRAQSAASRWSDHAPVTVTFDLQLLHRRARTAPPTCEWVSSSR